MVNTHILTVLSILPLSLAAVLDADSHNGVSLEPAHHAPTRQILDMPIGSVKRDSDRHGTQPIRKAGARKRSSAESTPFVGVGGVELELVKIESSSMVKRSANGTLLPLGTSQNTFVVPVSIGSPPTTYPLQLDLASSDILLASTLCGSHCPTSLGTTSNPYYDVSKTSAGFESINSNRTGWNTSYADGTVASGFLAREIVTLGDSVVRGQVFGMINATNLTLSSQKSSGILGLGFPRLSTLTHALFEAHSKANTNPSTSSVVTTETQSGSETSTASASTASTTGPAYFPTLLENLVRTPHLPYPVFALALSAPVNSSSTSTSSSAAASASSRYKPSIGSLTLGGVSSYYIDDTQGSGRTVQDIEWHDVVPFGQPVSGNDTATEGQAVTTNSAADTLSASSTSENNEAASASASASASSAARKRSDASQLDAFPSTISELSQEEYLYWTLDLRNVTVNGTNVGINSSYASIGLGSVALLDAGFNGIAGPQQDVVKLFRMITDAREVSEGQWAVPCNTRMTLGFSFGGRYIQLQPSDWIFAGIAQSTMCLAWPIAQPVTGDGIDWQLGTPFLKNVYTIFSSTLTSIADPNSPTPTSIAALSLATTLRTALPNAVLPDPTYPTPSYVYSATPALLETGVPQYLGLANNSAYEVMDVPVISVDKSAVSSIAVGNNGGSNMSDGASSAAPRRMSTELVVGMGVIVIGMMMGAVMV
ncbi:peptidase [Cryptococcus deuterogattii MMRL2647]|nr:peptidase [Cryptococcus deuterogattii MMRL2647]